MFDANYPRPQRRGVDVWMGAALALTGFLLQECSGDVGHVNWSPLVFFGALQLGVGLMRHSGSAMPRDSRRDDGRPTR